MPSMDKGNHVSCLAADAAVGAASFLETGPYPLGPAPCAGLRHAATLSAAGSRMRKAHLSAILTKQEIGDDSLGIKTASMFRADL